MNHKKQKTDEEIWNELLNSTEGAQALEHLLSIAELDIDAGNFIEEEVKTTSKKSIEP